jgi:hypothetical protein
VVEPIVTPAAVAETAHVDPSAHGTPLTVVVSEIA